MPLSKERLLESIKPGSLFGFVQCVIEVPENLREAFTNFSLIFNNINVNRDDSGQFMKEYDEKEGPLTQPRRMLISSYFLENNHYTVAAHLSGMGMVCRKIYRFVQYSPMKCFNNFLQSTVSARREGIQLLVLWQRR